MFQLNLSPFFSFLLSADDPSSYFSISESKIDRREAPIFQTFGWGERKKERKKESEKGFFSVAYLFILFPFPPAANLMKRQIMVADA